eukprot:3375475-Rhodomonas_salina.1
MGGVDDGLPGLLVDGMHLAPQLVAELEEASQRDGERHVRVQHVLRDVSSDVARRAPLQGDVVAVLAANLRLDDGAHLLADGVDIHGVHVLDNERGDALRDLIR